MAERNSRLLVCTEMLRLFSDYLEDDMPAVERLRFEEHLSLCDGCTAFLDNLRDITAAAGTIEEDDVPEDVQAGFMTTFELWKRGRLE